MTWGWFSAWLTGRTPTLHTSSVLRPSTASLSTTTAALACRPWSLDAGDGPAIFGPVITEPPTSDSDAVELFRHLV